MVLLDLASIAKQGSINLCSYSRGVRFARIFSGHLCGSKLLASKVDFRFTICCCSCHQGDGLSCKAMSSCGFVYDSKETIKAPSASGHKVAKVTSLTPCLLTAFVLSCFLE